MTHVRKVRVMYITDPGSDKSRAVYVTPTSQPNTYQVLPYTVVTTAASANSAPTVQHYVFTEASSAASYQPPPQQQLFHQQQQHSQVTSRMVFQKPSVSSARRALVPPPTQPRRNNIIKSIRLPSSNNRISQLSETQKLLPSSSSLPAPFDLPEIMEFLISQQSSQNNYLPLLTAEFVDEYFKEIEGSAPIVEDNFNVDTLDCPMLAPTQSTTKTSSAPSVQPNRPAFIQPPGAIIYRPPEQRKAPTSIKRPIQNHRHQLLNTAPYQYSKENRQIRILNPIHTLLPSQPRPKSGKSIRMTNNNNNNYQIKTLPLLSSTNSELNSNNAPLQMENTRTSSIQ